MARRLRMQSGRTAARIFSGQHAFPMGAMPSYRAEPSRPDKAKAIAAVTAVYAAILGVVLRMPAEELVFLVAEVTLDDGTAASTTRTLRSSGYVDEARLWRNLPAGYERLVFRRTCVRRTLSLRRSRPLL